MEHSTEASPPRVPAPRHLKRRRFREDIPDTSLVPAAEPLSEPPSSEVREPKAKRAAEAATPEEADYRRKRLVALLLVIAIAVSVPVLVVVLVLAG
ncbi:hypothetical protein [Arthrobacter sp. UYEF3]|uniref:hypothetical protein n=1 Tax=Arthrobacter sp. UYEF3 TaxID=1756365 RepID=UPI0033926560